MIGTALTHRIPTERPLWLAIRCSLGICLWARWELGTATAKNKTIPVDIREAICCGRHEVRVL
jgi:hypothetical protein